MQKGVRPEDRTPLLSSSRRGVDQMLVVEEPPAPVEPLFGK